MALLKPNFYRPVGVARNVHSQASYDRYRLVYDMKVEVDRKIYQNTYVPVFWDLIERFNDNFV